MTLSSYNASKLSALAYDATTRKLFFSDRHHHFGHIFSVSLEDESRNPVEDIVESNSSYHYVIKGKAFGPYSNFVIGSHFYNTESNNETVESLAYDPVNKILLWTDWINRSIRRVKIAHEHIHIEEKDGFEIVHFLEDDAKPRGLVFDPCTR